MLNPVCVCGEIMTAEDPGVLLWDYLPQSVDVRRLAVLAMSKIAVWACFGCGAWVPSRRFVLARPAPRKVPAKKSRHR